MKPAKLQRMLGFIRIYRIICCWWFFDLLHFYVSHTENVLQKYIAIIWWKRSIFMISYHKYHFAKIVSINIHIRSVRKSSSSMSANTANIVSMMGMPKTYSIFGVLVFSSLAVISWFKLYYSRNFRAQVVVCVFFLCEFNSTP